MLNKWHFISYYSRTGRDVDVSEDFIAAAVGLTLLLLLLLLMRVDILAMTKDAHTHALRQACALRCERFTVSQSVNVC